MWFVLCGVALHLACVDAGSFVDDSGLKHSWNAEKPKVVAWSFDALALWHMGMGTDQLIGTYGERSVSGSNHGGYYHDGNVADHGDHGNTAYDPSAFPSDPSTEERQMLAGLVDFSPGCSATNYWCAEFNLTVLQNNKPDVIVQGPTATLSDADVLYTLKSMGIPVIQMNGAYDGRADRGVGMIEIAQRFEELAMALGLAAFKVREATEADKQRMCEAVDDFKAAARAAQHEGVRALAAYIPYGAAGPNGEQGAFISTVETDSVLCMLEELGMPVMHNADEVRTGKGTSLAWEYKTTADWSAGTLDYRDLRSNEGPDSPSVKYPVDFWLYDQRVTLDFLSESFATAWPDKALLAKQYAYWPSGGGVFSYRHIAEILEEVAAQLKFAKRVHTEEATECTPAATGGINGELHRVHGMKPGEYACYEPVSYDMCNAYTTTTTEETEASGSPHAYSLPEAITMVLVATHFCVS